MAKNFYDITLAFAGINQAARLVNELAMTGNCDVLALRTSLSSILNMNPTSTLDVFGGDERNLMYGLEMVLGLLNKGQISTSVMRYTGGIMMLERRLSANDAALDELSTRLQQVERQLEHFNIDDYNIVGALSDIYVDIISPQGAKIQVIGSPDILQRSEVQAKVRALLFAGVRAAVLWRQVGGGKMQILLSRGKINAQAKQIINRI